MLKLMHAAVFTLKDDRNVNAKAAIKQEAAKQYETNLHKKQ